MRKMIREVSVACAFFLLCACAGRNNSTESVLLTSIQVLVGTNGNQLKYVGTWSSCTPGSDEKFHRNNISFASDGADLLFEPAIGVVGTYSDAACTQPVPDGTIGVAPVKPQRISSITMVNIAPQSNPRFTGTADELSDTVDASFKFSGFSTDYKSVWFSSTSSFDGVVTRYEKK